MQLKPAGESSMPAHVCSPEITKNGCWAGKAPPTGKCFSLHSQTHKPQNYPVAAAVTISPHRESSRTRRSSLCAGAECSAGKAGGAAGAAQAPGTRRAQDLNVILSAANTKSPRGTRSRTQVAGEPCRGWKEKAPEAAFSQ